MSTISKESGLSRIYTNRSLRATTVHVLDVARFPDRHIMSVTGHKAQSSLKTYTGYTDSKTKQNMSNTLSNALRSTTSENKRTGTYSNVQETVVKESKDTVLSYSKLDSACFELLPLNSSQEDQLMSEMQNDSNFDALLSSLDIPLCTQPTRQPLCECSQHLLDCL